MPTLIENIAVTVSELATPEMKPKKLFEAVKAKYPGASKGDLVRAAFLAVISQADADPSKADRMQAAALAERSTDPEKAKVKPKKRESKTKATENGKSA
jgi:hypothetical protein